MFLNPCLIFWNEFSSSNIFERNGYFDGETVHGGCAITLISTGTASCAAIMDHVGWRSKDSFERYSRINQLVDANAVSS